MGDLKNKWEGGRGAKTTDVYGSLGFCELCGDAQVDEVS